MLLEGRVGPKLSDLDDDVPLRLGYERQQVVSDLHGRFFEAAIHGAMFVGSTLTAGIALIVAAATGNHPTLWNPAGSGVVLEIARLDLTWISGVNAPGGIYWTETNPAGATPTTVAGSGPIITFTHVAPANVFRGSSRGTKARWAPAINTYIAAPAYLMPAGISLATMAAASTPQPFVIERNYDGGFIVGPGVAVSLCSQAATTTALFGVNVSFIETPLPKIFAF